VRLSSTVVLALILAVCSSARATTPTPIPPLTQCDPAADDCPVGSQCLCCCGTWVCMPPYLPCCALPCAEPTQVPMPTPTPTCHSIAGLTDCQTDSDCVVVGQSDCCPCQMGGHQAAINRSKRDEFSQQIEVCCAAAGVCPDVYQCENDPGAVCLGGTCTLVHTTRTPTPNPTPNECNPLLNNCASGTTCGCCCGAWECLDGTEICCEIACAVPTPPTTATPTPTPTPQVGTCVGDCDGDGSVTTDEIIRMVGFALNGELTVNDLLGCPGVDQGCSGPDGVTVDCITVTVRDALYGCGIKPTPMPTPQCRSDPCGGSCIISPPCTPSSDTACPNVVALGVCAFNPVTGCRCEPVGQLSPTPKPTPVLEHGRTCCECADAACVDFTWVEVERLCPVGCQTFPDAECEAPCHPGPVGGPAICASLTPCKTDADCDDGNACSIDRCTIDGCTHACVCV
jgi:hypothetical protein